ncbi:MAG TPA: prolipoprotein diacylglyceryl transferase [Candidatus Limnocylindrales bacterium]|nr:prolipoprotein diacylglyceryl transferase [Candidatus Limnocylindrales bacterium]
MFGLINITPGSQVIPGLPIGWYGVAYVIGLAALLLVSQREAERRGYAPSHIWNAFLVVAACALIGGRLYHVIDQWGQIYSQDPLRAILPPYSGLGLYGGVAGAAVGILIYTRWKKLPLRLALDVVIPGTLFAQGIARWGNFFNQELYGPPTDAPWGITIDCAHRVAAYACPVGSLPTDVPLQGFHPLFFYESSLDIAGGLIALYLSRRFLDRLQPGDLAAFWGIWYGLIRAYLETFREGWNWKLGDLPTAMLIGFTLAAIGVVWLVYNHRPGSKPYEYLPPYEPPSASEAEAELATDPAFDPDDENEET